MFNPRKREFDQVGQLADKALLLVEKGYTVNSWVSRKKDKITAQIKSMSNTVVILSIQEGDLAGTVSISHDSFHKGEWRVVKPPVEKVSIDHLEQYVASTNKEFMKKILIGLIGGKLLEMEKANMDVVGGLKLALKPHRKVIAYKKFSKGKLVLVPTTLRIGSKS